MGINEAALVSCYLDVAALVVMALLLFSEFPRRRSSVPLRIFWQLSVSLAVTCAMSFVCHAMYLQPAPWCHTAAVACRTVWEWLAFEIILLWAAYVEYKLYGNSNRRSPLQMLYILPFFIFTVLLLVNLFNGMIFTYTADNRCRTTWVYDLFVTIEAVCFMASLVKVKAFDRKVKKIRFLRVLPMVLPVAFGVALQYFMPYQADVLGFAIGALLVYFSMADENRFADEESGMYNRGFLGYLIDLALAGKNNAGSVLILEPDGDLPSCFGILRDTLHRQGDVFRMEDKKFLMFSETNSRSDLQQLSTQVEEAVARHNAEHPAETVRMTVRSRIRTGDEDLLSFLRSAVEEKDAGDPVRGVVSMISELDRLDNELKLAADIQLNMLPMNFPAFPDRTEFDLYAVMDPAKEVGGDFYDFFLIDKDHLGLVIADVSGKGIPAALFMMVSKTLIKNQLMSGSDPAAALERVNLQLCERNSSMMFVTVWAAVLEISTGRGTSCNAGHENPGLHAAGKAFETLRYKHGTVLGVNKKASYTNREFELHPGDSVFLYTDGVPEAANAAQEMFGEKRMLESLNRDAEASPEELIRRVHEDVYRFADGTPQFDDITMLCLQYRGPQEQKAGGTSA